MESIAEKLTNYIVGQKVINKEDYAIYKYGIQSGLEILLCILTCLLAAGKMNMLCECILLMIIFFSQRTYVKGIHLKHFWSCFIMSCGVIIAGLFLSQRLFIDRHIMMIITFCLYVVNLLATQCLLRELDKKEAVFYQKCRIFIFLSIWISGLVFMMMENETALFMIFYAEIITFISVCAEKVSEKQMKERVKRTMRRISRKIEMQDK